MKLEKALLNTDYQEKIEAYDTHLYHTRQINPLTGEMRKVGVVGKLDPGLFQDWQ